MAGFKASAALVCVALVSGANAQGMERLDEVRRLYVGALYEEVGIDSVFAVVGPLARAGNPVAQGYEGALTVLRARSATWPGRKLRHTRTGLSVLDPLVERHPENVELRFLRLISCYPLPRFLGRRWSVVEDFSFVAEHHGELADKVDDRFYGEVTKFISDHHDESGIE